MGHAPRSRIIEEMRDWLGSERNRSFQHDRRVDAIRRLLQTDSPADKDKAEIGSHLGILSNWHLILGAVRVADGDPAGWTDLRHGMRIDYWHVRLLAEQWDKDPRRNKPPRVQLLRPCLCMTMAMAFQDEDAVAWLGHRLEASVTDGSFGRWGLSHLPPFVLELYRRYAGEDGSSSACTQTDDHNPYAQVFVDWRNDEAFPQAIRCICECHVERSEDAADDVLGEFSRYPFSIVPFEVFAIERVRRRGGLTMPAIEHPLLSPPFDHVPAEVPDAQDDLLEAVKRLK